MDETEHLTVEWAPCDNRYVVLVLVLVVVGTISTLLTWMVEHRSFRSRVLVGDGVIHRTKRESRAILSTVLLFVGIFLLTLMLAYFAMALFWIAVSR